VPKILAVVDDPDPPVASVPVLVPKIEFPSDVCVCVPKIDTGASPLCDGLKIDVAVDPESGVLPKIDVAAV